MWFKKHKWKVILPVLIAALLAASFYFGGSAPGERGWSTADTPPANAAEAQTSAPQISPGDGPAPEPSAPGATEAPEKAEAPAEKTPDTPEDSPSTAEPSPLPAPEADHGQLSCTISISCEALLDNLQLCQPEKAELVPESGWILGPLDAAFTQGESVFDVLRRVCVENGVHLEFSETPAYGGVYIEGIYNLYEFDAGELSGWLYKVNGQSPNYSCSLYLPEDGDVISWVYTCGLGLDSGGETY